MLFWEIIISESSWKKRGLNIWGKTEIPAEAGRTLIFYGCDKPFFCRVVFFWIKCIGYNIQITGDFIRYRHIGKFRDHGELGFTFFICHWTPENIIQFAVNVSSCPVWENFLAVITAKIVRFIFFIRIDCRNRGTFLVCRYIGICCINGQIRILWSHCVIWSSHISCWIRINCQIRTIVFGW